MLSRPGFAILPGPAPANPLHVHSPLPLITARKEVSLLPEKVKRMNLNVPLPLHNAFKAATAAQGENMTDVLMRYIKQYIEKHSPQSAGKPASKGRRG